MGGLFGGGGTISNSESKIGALQIQQSTYGVPITVVFGTNRIAGNLLDYIDFIAIPHTTTQTSGGKGGGGVTQSNTTYTYTAALVIGLGEGPIAGIGKIWNDKSIVDLDSLGLSLFTGAVGQNSWDYMQSMHPERALNYPNTAYVVSPIFDLGSSANLPNLTFEFKGRSLFSGSLDSNPKDIITAILSDVKIGVGFPAQYISDLTRFSNYCIANNVLFSPAYSSQDEAHAPITTLCQAANSEPVWSQGKLKIVPYSLDAITANGVTYTPEQTEIPDLTIDDFVYEEGQPPVKVKPNLTADRYNIQPVEIMNRANDYNIEPVKATDDTNIGNVGPRPADSIEMHFITDLDVGQFAAQSILQRQLYVPKQYEFTLTWRHCLFDPMDVVTITELAFLGLIKEPVRIVDIEEDENFNLKITAEDCPEGVNSPALYSTQLAQRPTLNYNVDPGNTSAPAIFEPPAELTTTGFETWVAASGDSNWGGYNVWLSDDGNTYKRVGSNPSPARYGTLVADLSTSGGILKIKLTDASLQLSSGTADDAKNLRTICWVDGEAIAYTTATLTGVGQYTLTGLVRGAYNTVVSTHLTGSSFVRCDDAVFKYSFDKTMISKTIYIKLTSINVYGGAEQSLADVTAVSHVLSNQLPPNVSNITLNEDTYMLKDGTVLSDIMVNFTEPTYTILDHYNIYYDVNNSGQWQYSGPAKDGKSYKVRSLPQVEKIKVKITTVSKFAMESVGTVSTDFTLIGKSAAPMNVINLQCKEVVGGFSLTWDANTDADLKGYNILQGSGSAGIDSCIQIANEILTNSLFIPINKAGAYTFYVLAVDTSGNSSDSAASVIVDFILSDNVSEFLLSRNGDYVDIKWKAIAIPHVRYEIRRGDSWDLAEVICDTSETQYRAFMPSEGSHTFLIKAIDQYKNPSTTTIQSSITITPSQNRNMVLTVDQVARQWQGTKLNASVFSGDLRMDGGVVSMGEHIVEVNLPTKMIARSSIVSHLSGSPSDIMDWGSSNFAWNDAVANVAWFPITDNMGAAMRHQISRYIGLPNTVIESMPLNDTLNGEIATTPTENTGVTYTEGRFRDGLWIGDNTRVSWPVSIPSTFNLMFYIKLTAGINGNPVYMTLVGGGANLKVGYDLSSATFYLDDGVHRNSLTLNFSGSDYLTFGIVQTATQRKLFAKSYITGDSAQSVQNFAPVGSFTSLKLYPV